jgi:cytochrome P450
LGPSGIAIAESPSEEPDLPSPNFVEEVRALGAQLIVGSVSPEPVRKSADRFGSQLNRRVDEACPALSRWWQIGQPPDAGFVERNAVGLLWVGHPATVQAGALCMQELFARRNVLDTLARKAQAIGDEVWSDQGVGFRQELESHVLELLRFRPPFPILVRDVPRDTWFDVAPGIPPGHASAGSQIKLLTIGALFDQQALKDGDKDVDSYRPGREFRGRDDRYLMFGLGDRSCIAKNQVTAMLVSALTGLLTLPGIDWADPWYARIKYDGPTIRHMRLRFKRQT